MTPDPQVLRETAFAGASISIRAQHAQQHDAGQLRALA